MAKGTKKKKRELTIEEKLEQALVPEEEWPYEVPENWCWTYIQAGFDVSSSKRVHKKDWLSEGIPFYRTRELVKLSEYGYVENELFISQELYAECKENYGIPKVGDLLISGVGTIGVPYIVENEKPFYFKDGNVIWFQNRGLFLPKYIYYLYKGTFMYNQIHSKSAGTTVDTYTIVNAKKTIVPFPPLAEQKRIVNRIESLFAKLDEAKDKAQAVVDGFEDRKATILHKAFTGELTAEWRNKRGIAFSDSWKMCTLGDYASSQYGYTEKASYENIGPRFLRITDIQDGKVNWENVPYCKIDDDLKGKYSLDVGDIVVARTGATTGKSYMVSDEVDAVYASYLIRVSIQKKESLKSKYLYYFLQCPSYWWQITELSSGIAQPGVNGNKLKTLQLPIPNVDEQDIIIELLNHLLPVERQARNSAEQVLEQIDIMKNSILSRAFRGELGTNDSADESAEELLKRIL